PGPHSHMFVGYRAGAACSAYPTVVGGPGVYRAYERRARCARTIGRGSGDRRRHGRAVPGEADPVLRTHPFVGGGPPGSGGGHLRGRPYGVRVVSIIDRCWDPLRGRGAVEAGEAVR